MGEVLQKYLDELIEHLRYSLHPIFLCKTVLYIIYSQVLKVCERPI